MVHMVGADPAELDALAGRMVAAADRLESIRTRVGALLEHSHWDGHDADEFRHLWHHQLAPRLHSAAITTRSGATTVRVNAQEQRDVSNVGGGGRDAAMAGGGRGVCRDVPERSWLDRTFDVLGIGTLVVGAGELVADVAGAVAKRWPAAGVGRVVDQIVRKFDDLPPSRILKTLGSKLSFAALAIDLAHFRHEFGKDPTGAATFNAGVAVILDVAAKVPYPPVALSVSALSVVHGFASLDGSPENQEWLRGETIKQLAGVAAGPSLGMAVRLVPTDVFVNGANAAERAIDTALGIRNGGLNGVPEYCK